MEEEENWFNWPGKLLPLMLLKLTESPRIK
jgi:hypothetical protein